MPASSPKQSDLGLHDFGEDEYSDELQHEEEEGPLRPPSSSCSTPVKAPTQRKADKLSAAVSRKICAHVNCEETKHGKEKWCRRHKLIVDNMRCQAKSAGESGLMAKVFGSDDTDRRAMDEFETMNPAGKYARKQLIDWQEFSRTYFATTSITDRGRDIEMSFAD